MALGAISIAEHVHRVADRYPIHVALHTDHCQADKLDAFVMPLVEETERRRAAGRPNLFNGHMFDGSALPLKDNLDIAVKLRERFSKSDLVLEIEVGVVGGEEDGVRASAGGQALHDAGRHAGSRAAAEPGAGPPYLLAATFGNVHGVYKPGHVKLKPSILKDCQDAVVKAFGPAARFYFVFHGGSGSDLRDIHEALDYGVVKMNVDTDMQYAFTRAIADHCFKTLRRRAQGRRRSRQQEGLRSALLPRAGRAGDGRSRQARGDRSAVGRKALVKRDREGAGWNGRLDFTIARLGDCRIPSPMSGRSIRPRSRARPLSVDAGRSEALQAVAASLRRWNARAPGSGSSSTRRRWLAASSRAAGSAPA